MRVQITLDSLSARVIKSLADKDNVAPEVYLGRVLQNKVLEIVNIELSGINLMSTLLSE